MFTGRADGPERARQLRSQKSRGRRSKRANGVPLASDAQARPISSVHGPCSCCCCMATAAAADALSRISRPKTPAAAAERRGLSFCLPAQKRDSDAGGGWNRWQRGHRCSAFDTHTHARAHTRTPTTTADVACYSRDAAADRPGAANERRRRRLRASGSDAAQQRRWWWWRW